MNSNEEPEFLAFDVATCWAGHDQYFAEQGVRAFTAGDVPYRSTNNFAIACQHAGLLLALVDTLAEEGRLRSDEPVEVIDVGGGLGSFAAVLLRALEERFGDAGRQLAARLRFNFTDRSEPTVRQAAAGPELGALVAAGRVRPLLYDCARPTSLRSLDGEPVSARFHAVICNYLCCVLPCKPLQKRGDAWWQMLVRQGSAQALEYQWAPVPDLPSLLGDARHAEALRDLFADVDEASLNFPIAFFNFLDGVRPLLHPGAIVLVNDFGSVSRDELRGLGEIRPRFYGATLNHDVAFSLFDPFALSHGMDLLRTFTPLASLHTAAIRYDGAFPEGLQRAFEALYVTRNPGQDLLDFVKAGRHFLEVEDYPRAIRFWARVVELDPYHAEYRLLLGGACLSAGLTEVGRGFIEAGRRLDVWKVNG